MANPEHLKQFLKGSGLWFLRRSLCNGKIDLSGANLSGLDLTNVNLSRANLSKAKLTSATLIGADLSYANLRKADLDTANLSGANLTYANLTGANLHRIKAIDANFSFSKLIQADLTDADFTNAKLAGATLESATIFYTMFSNSDLTRANFKNTTLAEAIFIDTNLRSIKGLGDCAHLGPSTIDFRSLQKSGQLPLKFLRGLGLSQEIIEYMPSFNRRPVGRYSCFISYSSSDQAFADRLYRGLQGSGVRCWFAPHDMPIGHKILDEIDSAIHMRDKVLLIISKHSIKSDWVEDEVTKAFEEERKRGHIVLFPIRLDDSVIETNEAWAAKLRARHIGDFRRWKERAMYQKSFARVLRDLKVKKP
jgi:uncharacterized protein YjbI with pentapeptide repeats